MPVETGSCSVVAAEVGSGLIVASDHWVHDSCLSLNLSGAVGTGD